MKPIPAIVPAPTTPAQPTGGWIRPRLSLVTSHAAAGGAHRLAHHVPDQDAQRDRGRIGPGEQPHADRDAGVGQGEQRHDEVARPGVVQLLEPLVGGDGQPDAAAGLTGQLRGGLLAEQPEQVAGPLQVTARRGLGVGEQAHDEADDDRVHAGLEERHPGGRPEQEVDRPEPQPRGPDGQHHQQEAHPHHQRGHLQARAVKDRNNGQSGQVIHDGEGEQVGAHPVGQPGADQGQHAQRERGVGGHGRAPAVGPRAARVERQVDPDGDDHPAQADHQRERQPPALAQLAHVELAPGLQADHQEEERHQAGVHPAVQSVGQAHAADVHREPGGPERFVGPGRDVGPDQRGHGRGQQDRGAARLGAQELAQRGLQAPRPGGPPGQQRRRRLGFRHARILPGTRTIVAPGSALRAAGNLVLVLVGQVDPRRLRIRRRCRPDRPRGHKSLRPWAQASDNDHGLRPGTAPGPGQSRCAAL